MAKIDNAALKKGGFMAQKQKGFYSLRLHITAGHLDSHQLIGISKVADAFGHGYIHLTSRQAIEIPFINVEDADAAKAMLAEYGVEPGCCGARVRTVTGCQGSAVCPSGNIDSYKVATMLDKRYFGRDLPGKFKFGVTGCQNSCLKAEENDLGIKGGRKVQRKPDACIHCGICSKVCKPGAITDDGKKIVVDYGRLLELPDGLQPHVWRPLRQPHHEGQEAPAARGVRRAAARRGRCDDPVVRRSCNSRRPLQVLSRPRRMGQLRAGRQEGLRRGGT